MLWVKQGTIVQGMPLTHLPNVPRFVGVETLLTEKSEHISINLCVHLKWDKRIGPQHLPLPTPVGRGGVAQVGIVGPDDDFGVVQMGLNAQQRRRHVLVPSVPTRLAPGGFADAFPVILVRRDHHFAILGVDGGDIENARG